MRPLPHPEPWPPELALPPGAAPAFDAYLVVDWSASSTPKRGADSVWWVLARWQEGRLAYEALENPATRAAARETIAARLIGLAASGCSVLVGFDFAYGYPAGFAARLGLAGAPWRSVWRELAGAVVDRQDEGFNNRFEVAAAFNRALGGRGPFWGHPQAMSVDGLTAKKPALPWPVPELRRTDARIRGPKSAFQLNGAGCVGGQVLMGLPVLEWLRSLPELEGISSVWPFETGPALPERPPGPRIVHAEVYPSLIPHPIPAGWVKDRAQVVALASRLAALDAGGALGGLFAAPGALGADALRLVVEEEGWILGVM